MAAHQIREIERIARAAGLKILGSSREPRPPGTSLHEVGTARMGDDPRKSVLNKFCQSWDVPNLFVTDGAAWVSTGHQNPTLTMVALTARACDYIAVQLEKDSTGFTGRT